MPIETCAYARAGLLGNPSDGYYGKIIAITVKNFWARVWLEESDKLRIEAPRQDLHTFRDIKELAERIDLFGYYGGVRLVKAAIKKFHDYCQSQNIRLEKKNFTIGYDSTIPRQLGLGGSSAIITAALRALIQFYGLDIPIEIQPTIILDAELEELGINAGFMDRVIQVYEGCVYMDLDSKIVKEKGHGIYKRLSSKRIPPLYLAYKPSLGKVSGQVLDSIRLGFEKGERIIIDTLNRIAELAAKGRQILLQGDLEKFHELMNENFNLRSKIMTISEGNLELIRAARGCGASAKFAGSGGSIIGMYEDEEAFSHLVSELERLQAKVIKPIIE